MTPAEEIRQAVAHIRETFKGLPEGPWRHSISTPRHCVRYGSGWSLASADYEDSGPQAMKHMALWDPIVAELVAVLLESCAEEWVDMEESNQFLVDCGSSGELKTSDSGMDDALALARRINASKDQS